MSLFWWCSGMVVAASGLSEEILLPFLHLPSPLPSPSPAMPHQAGACKVPQAGRNQPLAGGGCREDANPVSYICRMPHDRSPQAWRGPCTCPSITNSLQPLRATPAPRALGAPSQGWEASGCRHWHRQVQAEKAVNDGGGIFTSYFMQNRHFQPKEKCCVHPSLTTQTTGEWAGSLPGGVTGCRRPESTEHQSSPPTAAPAAAGTAWQGEPLSCALLAFLSHGETAWLFCSCQNNSNNTNKPPSH